MDTLRENRNPTHFLFCRMYVDIDSGRIDFQAER